MSPSVRQLLQQPLPSNLQTEPHSDGLYRILSLDGGGAKGFYTLGVLKEIEALVGCPLHKRFDLIFGTSTGSIIASLLALGLTVDQIQRLYETCVPAIMKAKSRVAKSAALSQLANAIYEDIKFTDVRTGIGVVSTKWMTEKPMIFKSNLAQAHGRSGTFTPGFGVPVSEAIQASCSAYPFFNKKCIVTGSGDKVELIDGGYCANNPSLYALADAIAALNKKPEDIRLVSLGVGVYPQPKHRGWRAWIGLLPSVQLLQKTLEINTHSMEQLRTILFKNIPTVRINDTFERPEMATDFLEHDLDKLNVLRQRGSESFGQYEQQLKEFLL